MIRYSEDQFIPFLYTLVGGARTADVPIQTVAPVLFPRKKEASVKNDFHHNASVMMSFRSSPRDAPLLPLEKRSTRPLWAQPTCLPERTHVRELKDAPYERHTTRPMNKTRNSLNKKRVEIQSRTSTSRHQHMQRRTHPEQEKQLESRAGCQDEA